MIDNKLSTTIIEDYIKWSDDKPFVQDLSSRDSLWSKPTAKQFYKYLISSKKAVEYGKGIVGLPYTDIADFTSKLWNIIAVKPYVWLNDLCDLTEIKGFTEWKEKNPDAPDDKYFTEGSSLVERFERYFWAEVVVPFKKYIKDNNEITFVPTQIYEELNKKYKSLKYEHDVLDFKFAHKEMLLRQTEKCRDEYRSQRNFVNIFYPILGLFIILFTWLITYVSVVPEKTPNVKATETQQQFDITVNNPQNKDINLDVNHG